MRRAYFVGAVGLVSVINLTTSICHHFDYSCLSPLARLSFGYATQAIPPTPA